jgi:hypothetical protein
MNIKIKRLFKNISFLMTEDLPGRIYKADWEIGLALRSSAFDRAMMEHIILEHGDTLACKYRNECDFLKKQNCLQMFPYPQVKKLDYVTVEFDNNKKMPYVWHKNKRLYFPNGWSMQKAEETYRNYIEVENLLGGGYMGKAPHQYQTEAFHVKEGDVVVDAGAAEGLFALDVVEKASHVYVVEADPIWMEPLQATFEPFSQKTTIVNCIISDADTAHSMRLESMLNGVEYEGLFVKMDIEGSETVVVNSSRKLH